MSGTPALRETQRYVPPTHRSMSQTASDHPVGPKSHRFMRSGLVWQSQTRWRGASKRRVNRISRSGAVVMDRAPVFGMAGVTPQLSREQPLPIASDDRTENAAAREHERAVEHEESLRERREISGRLLNRMVAVGVARAGAVSRWQGEWRARTARARGARSRSPRHPPIFRQSRSPSPSPRAQDS